MSGPSGDVAGERGQDAETRGGVVQSETNDQQQGQGQLAPGFPRTSAPAGTAAPSSSRSSPAPANRRPGRKRRAGRSPQPPPVHPCPRGPRSRRHRWEPRRLRAHPRRERATRRLAVAFSSARSAGAGVRSRPNGNPSRMVTSAMKPSSIVDVKFTGVPQLRVPDGAGPPTRQRVGSPS